MPSQPECPDIWMPNGFWYVSGKGSWCEFSSIRNLKGVKIILFFSVQLPVAGRGTTWNSPTSSSASACCIPQAWCLRASYLPCRYHAPRLGSALPQITAISSQQTAPACGEPLQFSYPSSRHHRIPCNLLSGSILWTVLWLLCPAGNLEVSHRHFFCSFPFERATCFLSLLSQFLQEFPIIYFLLLCVCLFQYHAS